MTDTLSALDATFLEMEEQRDGLIMNLGGVMVFGPRPGGPPSVEQVTARVGERLGDLPRYRRRLDDDHAGRWGWPRWGAADSFDVGHHVSSASLPGPGGPAQLCDWIAGFSSRRLDRARPLWELVVLDGLEGGRWALAHKVHHALVDGLRCDDLGELALDPVPGPAAGVFTRAGDDGRTSELDDAPADDADALWRSLLARASEPLAAAARQGAGATAALRATLRPQETLARSRMLVELIFEEDVHGAPRTSLNVGVGPRRRYAYASCPLADLEAIGVALGGSIHDAALSACTAGLRRLLTARREALPEGGLRAMLPVTLRDAAASLSLGCRLGSLFVELPVAEAVTAVRHRRIVEAPRRLALDAGDAVTDTLVDLSALAPPIVHASLARLLYGTRLFNLTITDVLGPVVTRRAFGAPLCEVHPIVPLAAEHAVGIAVACHGGRATFGLSADGASMSDLDVLAEGIEAGIGDLLTCAGVPAHATSTIAKEL